MSQKSQHTPVTDSILSGELNSGLLHRIFDTLPCGIQLISAIRNDRNEIANFSVTFTNKKAKEFLTLSRAKKLFPDKNIDSKDKTLFEKLSRVVETGTGTMSFRELHKNDKNFSYYEKITKFEDGILIIYEDISQLQEVTEKLKSELRVTSEAHHTGQKELKETQNLLQTVFDSNIIALSFYKPVFDAQQNPTDLEWLLASSKIHQCTDSTDLTGKRFSEIFRDATKNGMLENYFKVWQTGKRADFETFWEGDNVNGWYRIIVDKAEDGLIVISENISERKTAELDLKAAQDKLSRLSTDKYRSLLANMQQAFCIIEIIFDGGDKPSDAIILEENAAAKTTFGKSLLGKQLKKNLPADYFNALLDAAAKTHASGKDSEVLIYSETESKWLDFHLSKIGDENSRQVVAVFSDITGRKNRENNLSFLSTLTHELLSLTSIRQITHALGIRAAAYFGADKCAFMKVSEDNKQVIVFEEWNPTGPSLKGVYNLPDFLANDFAEATRSGEILVVPDINSSAIITDKERYKALGIGSFLSIPLLIDNQWKFSIGIYHSGPYDWRSDEIQLMTEVTDRIYNKIERTRAEDELRNREAELSMVQEIGGVGGIDIYINDELRSWRSSEYLKLHGLPQDTGSDSHQDWLARLHPEDRQRAEQTLQDALYSKETTYINEYRIIRPNDGQVRWILAKASIYRDEAGNPLRLIGAHIDITERKQHEESLRKSEEAFRTIANVSPAFVWVGNAEGENLFMSESWYSYSGQTPEETRTNGWTSKVHPDDIKTLGPLWEKSRHSGKLYEGEARYLRNDGQYRWHKFRALPRRNKDGEIETWYGISVDIHDAKTAEENLREAQQRYSSELEQKVNDRTAELQANRDMLQSVFDASLNTISVFTAVRDKTGKITDFKYLLVNALKKKDEGGNPEGRFLSQQRPELHKSDLFKRYADVVETGATHDFEVPYQSGEDERWYRIKAVKLGDGLVATGEDITVSRKSELELRENRELLAAIAEYQTVSLIAFKAVRDASGNIADLECIFVNRGTTANINISDLVGKRLNELSEMPEKEFFADYKTVIETGKTFEHEYEHIKDGESHWFRSIAVQLEDGLMVSTEDITTKKRAEESLLQQANLIRGISEALVDILYIMNIETHEISFASRAIAMTLGYSEKQISKMKNPFFDIMLEEDVMPMIAHIEGMKNAAPGEVNEIEYRLKHANGQIHYFCDRNTVFSRNEKGVPVEKLGIAQDITQRKMERVEIAKQHSILRQSEEIAKTGSWEYDVNTKEFLWSDGMYRLFEKRSGEAVRPSIYEEYAVAESAGVAKEIVTAIEKDWKPFEETLTILADGKRKTMRVIAKPFQDKNGLTAKMLGIDMDITGEVEADKKIQRLNKSLTSKNRELESVNSELQTFTGIAANDYKDTLKNLYTNLEFLIINDSRNLSNSGKANIRKAQNSIQKMKLLTDDIVNFSKIPHLDSNRGEVDLNSILSEVISDMTEKIRSSNASIEYEKLPKIQGFPLLLSLLFYHLLDNAVKFREKGHAPNISITYKKDRSKQLSNHMSHQISFTDDGIGFDPKESEQLFDIFFKVHEKHEYRGSGVGLAVCKKIMDLHGGVIAAQAHEAQGAVFTCYFPADQA